MDVRFALLLACFLGSGTAALLYQTAWTRELSTVFGTSELAVATVLASYMGGLALGAAVAARLAPRLRRPVLAYGLLELAIAVSALAVPAQIRWIDALYAQLAGGAPELPDAGAATTLLQLAGAFAVLLPPTAFMGATLPLLARHAVRSESQIGSRIGMLYAVNTVGAILGTIAAAFWLIPELGLRRTVWVGAAMNGAVFALAAVIARGSPVAPDAGAARGSADATGASWILPAIALSGAVSFAYEVVWTRLLGHVLGASLHAFATMLASFLLGIALGSGFAARWASTRERARLGFAVAQLGIAITAYATFALADRLPELARRIGAGLESPLASAALAGATLLPITLCIGATFPCAVRWLARRPEQASGASARVYAWNTAGAIAGALGAGFVLLPGLGFEGTLRLGVAASLALAALGALAAVPRRAIVAGLAAALALVLVVVLPPPAPWLLLRQSPLEARAERGEAIFSAVGRSSTVILVDRGTQFHLFTNGLPEAGTDRAEMVPISATVAYWLGMLPSLLRPDARELLVVGLGGGVALESVPSSVAAIDVIELEPEVVAANRAIAGARARDPLADPRVRVHLGDARGALRLCEKRYDAIVSQPSHPWTAGASHLYTREFFALAHSHLAPDGVFVQWIGLPFVDEALLRSLAAALVEVFGHVEVYAPAERGVLFAASDAPIAGLANAAEALRRTPADYARFAVYGSEDLASAWLFDEEGVRALARGAAPNTDDENQLASRAAHLAGRGLNPESARALLRGSDPLRALGGELDRGRVLRKLVELGHGGRAREIALAGEGAAEEGGLGWIDLADGRTHGAARHFARARELAPGDPDALIGLVASRRGDLRSGPVAEIPEAELPAPIAAVITGWRAAERKDWDAVAALDAELVRVAPGHALRREASRLRALWRLEQNDAMRHGEAVEILETSLVDLWHPEDALLHARAAVAVNRPGAASGSLERIADVAPRNERGRDLARRALKIAESLPDDTARRLRAKLASRAAR